jgi:hypothetical protein
MTYRSEAQTVIKETRWTFWKVFWLILLITVMLSITSFALKMASRPAEVIDKVTNADRIIFNYEWFFDTYNDTQALDRQIQGVAKQIEVMGLLLGADRNAWSREDRTEWNRLNAVLLGLRTQRDTVIADYNSKSSQLTRNLFKDRSLPYQLQVIDDTTKGLYAE